MGAAPAAGAYQAPYSGGYQPYTTPAGFPEPPVPPPVPPVPPVFWRRREPIGAIILIGFGLLLLLNQLGYMAERLTHYLWPLILIAIGVWLIMRRVGDIPPHGQGPAQGDPGRKGGAQ